MIYLYPGGLLIAIFSIVTGAAVWKRLGPKWSPGIMCGGVALALLIPWGLFILGRMGP